MLPLISVIVPIYNVEKYLTRCVDSIIHQTYQNIEIILVDDGSPDGCPAMCDEYALKDPRIKVIHKANGGLSSARNAGIDHAEGDLYSFIDSDDYIAPNMLDFLYRKMVEVNADISICGRYLVFEDGQATMKAKKDVYLVLDSEDAIRKMCSFQYFDMSSCDRLYKKALFSDLRFPVGKLCEDWYVMYHLFDKAAKIVYDSTPLYYYYQREKSISHNEEINDTSIDVSRELMNFVNQYYPNSKKEAATLFAFSHIYVYNNYINYNKSCDPRLLKQLKYYVGSNLMNIFRNQSITQFKKIQAFIFYFSSPIYSLIYKFLKYK